MPTSRRFFVLIWLAIALCGQLPEPSVFATANSNPGAEDAQALIRAGHWKRARALLESQVKASPKNPRTLYLLAEVRRTFKDLNAALPLARQAVALDARNSNYHLELGRVYGEMAAQASLLSAASLAAKFRKEVEEAVRLDPRNLEALDALMQFKLQAPRLMGGSKEEARALAAKIGQIDRCQGYLAQAELVKLESHPAQAEVYLLQAVQADPKCYDAVMALAEFYTQPLSQKFDPAVKYAEMALRLDGQRVGAYWVLARAFAHQQRWVELDHILASSARSVPDDLRPYYEAAHALLDVGTEYAKAESYAKMYLAQEPEGEEPDAADAQRLLGLVLRKQGHKAQARLEFQTALLERPNYKAAKQDLKKLNN